MHMTYRVDRVGVPASDRVCVQSESQEQCQPFKFSIAEYSTWTSIGLSLVRGRTRKRQAKIDQVKGSRRAQERPRRAARGPVSGRSELRDQAVSASEISIAALRQQAHGRGRQTDTVEIRNVPDHLLQIAPPMSPDPDREIGRFPLQDRRERGQRKWRDAAGASDGGTARDHPPEKLPKVLLAPQLGYEPLEIVNKEQIHLLVVAQRSARCLSPG